MSVVPVGSVPAALDSLEPACICPACGCSQATAFVIIPNAAVNCNELFRTRDTALRAPQAPIELAYCCTCQHVFNSAFDAGMISYTTAYENSLHFSPRFQQYACDLVKYLANAYELKDRSVIEVGCGKGEFLRMLVESTHARGIGFDPGVPDTELSESYISFIQDYYSEKYSEFRCRLL